MIEPQSLLPITRFSAQKLVRTFIDIMNQIAVGDPLQLPPIVSFEYSNKIDFTSDKYYQNLKNPLFLRLQQSNIITILLRTQYRVILS